MAVCAQCTGNSVSSGGGEDCVACPENTADSYAGFILMAIGALLVLFVVKYFGIAPFLLMAKNQSPTKNCRVKRTTVAIPIHECTEYMFGIWSL